MQLTGWGRYPFVESAVTHPDSGAAALEAIRGPSAHGEPLGQIPRGLGRSYGDSSLAPSVIDTARLDRLIDFDEQTGLLRCGAGVSLAEILEVFVPRGWFLPVTPGTKFVTVGGAIASDVHGKNHHIEGTFCDHVTRMGVATPAAGIVECSPDEHAELFHGTCGGMGLTGVVVDATFRLQPIESAGIDSTMIRAANLSEALDLFAEHEKTTYSVAWIDCLARGRALGRSLLSVGEHASGGELETG
ncbi:MAG: FAD-binding oxidoreductase, partial [bacterium]|nr:FAD-binding oxidoreductase [bacterium]